MLVAFKKKGQSNVTEVNSFFQLSEVDNKTSPSVPQLAITAKLNTSKQF